MCGAWVDAAGAWLTLLGAQLPCTIRYVVLGLYKIEVPLPGRCTVGNVGEFDLR